MTKLRTARATQRRRIARLYEGIGRFAVEFERVCSKMRTCIAVCFREAGLRQPTLVEAALARMGADELRRCMHAVFLELKPMDSEGQRIVGQISVQLQKFIEKRNELLHAEWHIGGDLGDEITAPYEKLSTRTPAGSATGKTGLVRKQGEYRVSDFVALRKEAEEIQERLMHLHGGIVSGDPRDYVRRPSRRRRRGGLFAHPDSWKLPPAIPLTSPLSTMQPTKSQHEPSRQVCAVR